ncbi:MAG: hypothetical protein BWY76_01332 [bacterium ADurb.Bin429]|nr:MAG: hypothetical protein BWY76_01332 [bacterium ADurb.Bin429]
MAPDAREVIIGEWARCEDEELARRLFPFIKSMHLGRQMLATTLGLSIIAGLGIGVIADIIITMLIFFSGLNEVLSDTGVRSVKIDHVFPVTFEIWPVGTLIFSVVCLLLPLGAVLYIVRRKIPFRRVTLANWMTSGFGHLWRAWWPVLIASALMWGMVLLIRLLPVHRIGYDPQHATIFAFLLQIIMLGYLGWVGGTQHEGAMLTDRAIIWWARRPDPLLLERALREQCAAATDTGLWPEMLEQRMPIYLERPPALEQVLRDDLLGGNWEKRFYAMQYLARLGGVAVEPLAGVAVTGKYARLARWLLRCIGRETTARLTSRAEAVLCPTCLCHPGPHHVSIALHRPVTYFGCRCCGQSETFREHRPVVAVLDARVSERMTDDHGGIRVNWLAWDRLFDFDRVEIIHATDYDVERFCVLVGNDTDNRRISRYRRMPVAVAATCVLSENTIRVLRSRFGRVELAPAEGVRA